MDHRINSHVVVQCPIGQIQVCTDDSRLSPIALQTQHFYDVAGGAWALKPDNVNVRLSCALAKE
jgi:hypothetical protein